MILHFDTKCGKGSLIALLPSISRQTNFQQTFRFLPFIEHLQFSNYINHIPQSILFYRTSEAFLFSLVTKLFIHKKFGKPFYFRSILEKRKSTLKERVPLTIACTRKKRSSASLTLLFNRLKKEERN